MIKLHFSTPYDDHPEGPRGGPKLGLLVTLNGTRPRERHYDVITCNLSMKLIQLFNRPAYLINKI